MNLDDEVKGFSRFLFGWLGFPLGLVALSGAFSLGVAIFRDEISLSSRRLVLGTFLISFSAFAYHLPTIYSAVISDQDKIYRRFRFSSLVWAILFGAITWLSGRLLWHLMTATTSP
jgi:hypothetical protein